MRKSTPKLTRSRSRSVSKSPVRNRRPGVKKSPLPEFKVRSSLLDSDTSLCELADCDDAWRTLNEPDIGIAGFSDQPFSRQIKGWVHLFWFLIAFYVGNSWYEHFRATGSWYAPRSWHLLHLGFGDLWSLFGLDVGLICFTFFAVPVQKLILKRIIPAQGLFSWILRHGLAISPMAIAARVCIQKQWPGLQIGMLMMHSIVLFMKMHSYFEVNRILQLGSLMKSQDSSPYYPGNIGILNFADYLLVPTLVYSPNYPRAKKIRCKFLFDRTLGALVIVSIVYTNVESYVLPPLKAVRNKPFVETFADLLLPLALTVLLLFFLVFEYILNWFAEVTQFADRQFYSDWWNSLDYAEFSRKWNIPVHKFFQTHVYIASRENLGWSKGVAAFWTFLFSSILHELTMSMAAKQPRYEFFCCQMIQIPVMFIWNFLGIRQYSKAANMLFWIFTFTGTTGLLMIYAWHTS